MKSLESVEHKVPHLPELNHNDVFSVNQANAFVEMGIVDERPDILRSETYKEYQKQELSIETATGLVRSNFDRSRPKWNKIKNSDGVYEVPYRFTHEFPFNQLVKVS